MPDVFTSIPKLIGDAGKFPRVQFNYRLTDSQTQKTTLLDRSDDSNLLVFPDMFFTLSEAEKVDFLFYVQNWFLNRDMDQINNSYAPDSSKEIRDTSLVLTKETAELALKEEVLDPVLK